MRSSFYINDITRNITHISKTPFALGAENDKYLFLPLFVQQQKSLIFASQLLPEENLTIACTIFDNWLRLIQGYIILMATSLHLKLSKLNNYKNDLMSSNITVEINLLLQHMVDLTPP